MLPDGMVIFLQEDHELPLIDGIARTRGGPVRTGGENRTGGHLRRVWRTGGTKAQNGNQLDDYLEIRAAKVETNGDADSTSISWSCLKGDFDDVFKIFDAVLREPAFRDDKLDLSQKEYFDAISRRNDNVDEIASRESAKLVYGPESLCAGCRIQNRGIRNPARSGRLAPHLRSTQQHCPGNRWRFRRRCNEGKTSTSFGNWAKGPAAKEKIEFQPAKPGYYFIEKEDVNQSSSIWWGWASGGIIPITTPFEFSTRRFGGGFSSRLFRTIRTEKGLAYGVGGGIGSAFDHPGMLRMSMGTKSVTTIESIQAIDEQIHNLAKDPISDAEIKRAKDAILNGFVFNLDSPEKVLREHMAYEFFGYPADYLERFRAGVEKVTTADVARVASKYLHKESTGGAGRRTQFRIRQATVIVRPADKYRYSDPTAPWRTKPSGSVAVVGRTLLSAPLGLILLLKVIFSD